MTVKRGKDHHGSFYQSGGGKKHYYVPGDSAGRARAQKMAGGSAGRKKHVRFSKRVVYFGGGEGADPISAVAGAVGSVMENAPALISAAQAANDNRLANQYKQRVEWRQQRLTDDFIPYFDNLGSQGKLGDNSMARYWSKYQDGKGKYGSMQDAYNAEGLPGILPILVRIDEWQIPLGPDSLVRADWDRPYW